MAQTQTQVQTVFKRSEVKFLLDRGQRARLERVMAERMEQDAYGPSTICSLYYDTPTLLLARRSADHPTYKEKVRERSYGVLSAGEPVFAEIKKKWDGVVYKRRVELPEAEARALLSGHGRPRTQIEREIDFTARRYEGLAPRALVAYDRVGYFSPEDHEFRMTLDARPRARWERLSLADGDDGEAILEGDISILEVKCLGGMPLWLVRHLSEEGIRSRGCSKYVLACRQLLAQSGAGALAPETAPVRRQGAPAAPRRAPRPVAMPSRGAIRQVAHRPAHMRL